jgi:vancomycin resistance protein YoaR
VARLASLFAALLFGVLLGALGWVSFVPAPPTPLELRGYFYPIEEGSEAEQIPKAIALRATEVEREPVAFSTGEQIIEVSVRDLGLTIDQAAAVEQAGRVFLKNRISLRKDPALWVWRRFSQKVASVPVELSTRFDREKAEAFLGRLASQVDSEAVDAKLLIAEHSIVESVPGRRLSVPATLVRLEAAALDEGFVLHAVVDEIRPRVTEDDLAPVDVTKVLSSYETSFRGKAGARAVNIRTAGNLLNGAIVLPGEVLSFNHEVGRRIHGRGFVDAPVILNDELEMDVGGGVCQVATTLHAAAIYGNLEVVRRRSHSRPSGYAPLGLDATVIDGKVDLQLRNPFDEPVLVHVSFPDKYRIRVELLGRNPDAQVEHAYTVTHREPFARRVWYREEMPVGGVEQKQKGSEGMDVVSVLRIQAKDGGETRRSYSSKYYPVPEVFWLGEGASSSALPKMPEGMTTLVVDGEPVEGATNLPEPRPEEEVPSLSEAVGSSSAPLH